MCIYVCNSPIFLPHCTSPDVLKAFFCSGESFLKLYVFFNMLELFERWLRSVGVDLFDLLAASCRQGPVELLPKYLLAPWHRRGNVPIQFILIHTDSYWFILIHTDSYWFILIHTDSYWFILIHTDSTTLFLIILLHFSHSAIIGRRCPVYLRHWHIVLFTLPCICSGYCFWQSPSTPLRCFAAFKLLQLRLRKRPDCRLYIYMRQNSSVNQRQVN